MNVPAEKSGTRLLPRCGFCLVLLILFLPGPEARSQDTGHAGKFLPPPKANLVPVHWPDLTKLEADVRKQLAALQAELAATIKDPKATEATFSEAYGTMGKTYQAYTLNSPARECYLNAASLAPQDFRWIYLLGTLDQQEDRTDDAIRRYRVARALRPEYLAVPVNLGNIYLQLNRQEDASESFKAALAIDGNCAAALYGLGQIALSQRNYTEAVKYFEKALALASGANRIHYSLAMAYRGLGNIEKVKAHLSQQGTVGVRVNDPLVDGLQELIKGERVHLIRGKLAVESQRYAEAIDEFRKALASNPDSLTARINLGATLIQVGDLKGAAEQFEVALRIDPRNTNAHYNLAILLARENKHEAAVSHLQFVVTANPSDLSARLFLAKELLRSKRPEEALAEFTRVAEADPNNEEALLEQVKLLRQKRQYRQALDILKRGHEQYPQKGQTALMLAYLLATSPEYDLRDGARSLELAQMIYDATGSPEHGALVAMALAELGRCAEAAEWQRRMIGAAEQERRTSILAKLKSDLKLYEVGPPCRPAPDIPGQQAQN